MGKESLIKCELLLSGWLGSVLPTAIENREGENDKQAREGTLERQKPEHTTTGTIQYL